MPEIDYLIVGGGSAGCVLADRLSEDGKSRVLLLEAGGGADTWLVKLSFGFAMMLDNPRYDWRYAHGPEPHAGGRTLPYPRGRILGGSSSINAMLYVRGLARDYDAWAEEGLKDWSWAGVEPYLRAIEDYPAASPWPRGKGGPTKVSLSPNHHPLTDIILEAAGQSSVGFTEDYNGAAPSGIGLAQHFYRDGRRCGSVAAYLQRARRRPNLQIVTGADATGLTFEGRRCTGMNYRQGGVAKVATARETILAAGAIGSPQLMEVSGLGQAARLQALGIAPVADLPAVGEQLQDHYLAFVVQNLKGVRGLGEQLNGWRAWLNGARYLLFNRGYLGSLPTQVNGHADIAVGDERVGVQFMGMPLSFVRDPVKKTVIRNPEPAMMLGVNVCRPLSRGYVHIASPDASEHPEIVANFLAEEQDVAATVAGLRLCREIVAQPALAPYLADELGPSLAAQSDEAIEAYARVAGASAYHPVGTCRMGIDPVTSVVDPALEVHGVGGLRIVDASVMPRIVSANTHAPTVMIAEKAADIIRGKAGPAR